jgi:hypothetical protein
MQAEVGDRVVIPGRHVGEAERIGEVLDCRGENGGPPYLVRWSDGHEALLYPGAEARVVNPEPH